MVYFSEIYGLVTKHDPVTENGGLFLAQYVASNPSEEVKNLFLKKMDLSKTEGGFYKRSAEHKKRSVSHDEITGMMATSFVYGTIHKDIIWSQLKRNFGAYPAVKADFSDYLPYNPGNYYAWGQYAGSKMSYVYFPVYFANMALALSKEKQQTSSKLIYWLELETMPKNYMNNFLKKFFVKKVKAQYGENYLYEMRKIYFNQEDEYEFPLFTVLKEAK